MNTEQEPRPCPFCGSTARIITVTHSDVRVFSIVKCDGCGVATGNWLSRKDALHAWNRRQADADELRRERAEYERLKAKFKE